MRAKSKMQTACYGHQEENGRVPSVTTFYNSTVV